jgi:hypothetical protein
VGRISDDDLRVMSTASNVYDREVAAELLAAREKLRELEPRPLREGDLFETPMGNIFTAPQPGYLAAHRIVRVPIPSAAAPPAEPENVKFEYTHNMMEPAPPQQPAPALNPITFIEGVRVKHEGTDETSVEVKVSLGEWPEGPPRDGKLRRWRRTVGCGKDETVVEDVDEDCERRIDVVRQDSYQRESRRVQHLERKIQAQRAEILRLGAREKAAGKPQHPLPAEEWARNPIEAAEAQEWRRLLNETRNLRMPAPTEKFTAPFQGVVSVSAPPPCGHLYDQRVQAGDRIVVPAGASVEFTPTPVTADLSEKDELRAAADARIDKHGRIDATKHWLGRAWVEEDRPLRAALRAIVESSCEVDTVRKAALALIGGGP